MKIRSVQRSVSYVERVVVQRVMSVPCRRRLVFQSIADPREWIHPSESGFVDSELLWWRRVSVGFLDAVALVEGLEDVVTGRLRHDNPDCLLGVASGHLVVVGGDGFGDIVVDAFDLDTDGDTPI